jgi:hypothetical protein
MEVFRGILYALPISIVLWIIIVFGSRWLWGWS